MQVSLQQKKGPAPRSSSANVVRTKCHLQQSCSLSSIYSTPKWDPHDSPPPPSQPRFFPASHSVVRSPSLPLSLVVLTCIPRGPVAPGPHPPPPQALNIQQQQQQQQQRQWSSLLPCPWIRTSRRATQYPSSAVRASRAAPLSPLPCSSPLTAPPPPPPRRGEGLLQRSPPERRNLKTSPPG